MEDLARWRIVRKIDEALASVIFGNSVTHSEQLNQTKTHVSESGSTLAAVTDIVKLRWAIFVDAFD